MEQNYLLAVWLQDIWFKQVTGTEMLPLSIPHAMSNTFTYILGNPPLKVDLVGVDGEEERRISRMAGIVPFGLITDSMFTRCWIVKAAWTKWNSFVLLVCAKSQKSSDPASHFSSAKAEASTTKPSKHHGVFCHKRQFPALTEQILCRGAGASAFPPWAQPVICIVTWIAISISPSCLICASNFL